MQWNGVWLKRGNYLILYSEFLYARHFVSDLCTILRPAQRCPLPKFMPIETDSWRPSPSSCTPPSSSYYAPTEETTSHPLSRRRGQAMNHTSDEPNRRATLPGHGLLINLSWSSHLSEIFLHNSTVAMAPSPLEQFARVEQRKQSKVKEIKDVIWHVRRRSIIYVSYTIYRISIVFKLIYIIFDK